MEGKAIGREGYGCEDIVGFCLGIAGCGFLVVV